MLGLSVSSGTFWSITYPLIIKRGFQDKACGMPMAALCLNISWEFLFSFLFIPGAVQRTVNLVWFGLDLIILAQYLFYERGRRPADWSVPFFYAAFVCILAAAFLTVLLATCEFSNPGGTIPPSARTCSCRFSSFACCWIERTSPRSRSTSVPAK